MDIITTSRRPIDDTPHMYGMASFSLSGLYIKASTVPRRALSGSLFFQAWLPLIFYLWFRFYASMEDAARWRQFLQRLAKGIV